MRHEVATIRHLVQTTAAHFQLCAQGGEGFTSAAVAGIINRLVLVCPDGFGVASAGPIVIWAAHRAPPENQRLGMANQMRSASDCSAALMTTDLRIAARSNYRPSPRPRR